MCDVLVHKPVIRDRGHGLKRDAFGLANYLAFTTDLPSPRYLNYNQKNIDQPQATYVEYKT